MSTPDSYSALAARIHERARQLTPAYRTLADQVLQDPAGVAFLSVAEFAEQVGVNVSTVSRFAQFLGLPGYPALRRLCKQHLHDQAQLVHRLETAGDPATAGDLWERAARADQQNLARTFARLPPGQLTQVSTLLSAAPAVHVLGLRKSHSPAYLLWYLLQLVRQRVRLLTPGTIVDQLREVHPGDAFVALAIHRYSADTVTGFRCARQRGAATVAITDNTGSPLLPSADHALLTDTTGPAVLRSMTAVVSLVQAIAAEVAARLGAESREALATEEALLEEFAVYYEPPRRRSARAGRNQPTT
ncbi:MurR/RpiR family transcriptional regulator [Natronosporangium hydrolyticum]|uniref:MurR/RpiR family transcriptional regulator n=1 Tax=Natronosporangium hydrolyticum TaxID=2811111 RepID=A0A895YJY7_9ACTN|nr:MurR/RpiR family transcriptional regulator [Natronosporangium hydrolyticum]QSB15653.1 MurR/RpiR family transcriptional regulator [Natronosporangium hydrolyticum]